MSETTLPEIAEEKCNACGLCAESCPEGAVTIVAARPAFTAGEVCTYCGICEDLCPTGAIELSYEIQ